MHILLVQYELFLPDSHSLKDKRGVMKPLLNAIRRDWNVSAAETESHDHWQLAVIATICVGNMREALEGNEREISKMLEEHPDLQVSAIDRQWL